jgi:hypothetical protein
MSIEAPEPAPELSRGEKWLTILGPEYLGMADQPTEREVDGKVVLVRDFHLLCKGYAEAFFAGLEDPEDPNDPDYLADVADARDMFHKHFGPPKNED